MRSRSVYFAFWFPTLTLCGIAAGYFVVMWSNAPKIPSQGMEALIALPYALASLAMAPFIVGLGVLLWQHPRRGAFKLYIVIPTITLTVGGVIGFYLMPRASADTYAVSLVFVDEQGRPVSDLSATVVYSSPEFDIFRGSNKTPRTESLYIKDNKVSLTKTKAEEAELRIEKEGFYLTEVTIPQVWPAKRNYGLQRIHIGWQKDWSGGRWGVDACQATMNWPLHSKESFKVVMLDWSSPAKSPFPEYSEEDFRAFQDANK